MSEFKSGGGLIEPAPRALFSPVNRTYTGLVTNQSAQNYNALVFGDVAGAKFVHRPEGQLQPAVSDGTSGRDVASTVAAVALPEVAVDPSKSTFNVLVTTTDVDPKNKLVGFQGDLVFAERVATFQSAPGSNAAQGTLLLWAASPDDFIFIDADLNTQRAGDATPGSVMRKRK